MKKTIQKPENWQDFETLCKRLWGEIWEIPTKVKKNGRNGQAQAGVDIYGVPKGEFDYWGIQCKGKDDYANAKLSIKEIDIEIAKANKFKPDLSVFIFATTMNKNSSTEEYIRVKDLESRKKGKFEILLYCWEDIADLIEDNQDTYNFWVADKQHKTKFNFEVSLNDFQSEYTVKPKCIRTIKKYRVRTPAIDKMESDYSKLIGNSEFLLKHAELLNFNKQRINEAICSFNIIMQNNGTNVIEDWRVEFTIQNEFKELIEQLSTGPMGMIDLNELKHKRTMIEDNRIFFSPKDNEPLIQKDNRYFKTHIIPECKNYKIIIGWRLLARDFNSEGIIHLNVEPEIEDKIIFVDVDSKDELKKDEIMSITEKKNYEDDK